jgi:hypothetical protein
MPADRPSRHRLNTPIARVALAATLGTLVWAGCDDGTPAARTTSGGVAPAAGAPATRPSVAAGDGGGGTLTQPGAVQASAVTEAGAAAETQPVSSFLSVDDRVTEFPAARLRLARGGGGGAGVSALLFSDDPKDAARADYAGNSFYFDMDLDAEDVDRVGGTEFWLKAPTSEALDAVESSDGIFLDGMRTHLQPQDVVVRFEGKAPTLTARVVGRFLVVNKDDTGGAPPRHATVSGMLFLTVETQE